MPIKIALPKGRLLPDTAKLAARAGWELSDYSEGARLYHLSSARFPNLSGKILHEKDIPIQVAMGNYDIGICGLDWIQELVLKYPASGLVKVFDLGYGGLTLCLAVSHLSPLTSLESVRSCEKVIDIASEYPNLAESLALNTRLKRFNIFPIWGAAEIYPPENADLVLIAGKSGQEFFNRHLIKIAEVLHSRAYLIANQSSWESKDLSEILRSIDVQSKPDSRPSPTLWTQSPQARKNPVQSFFPGETIRMALPDGHAQKHVANILNRANINIRDYPSESGNRRPEIDLEGVTVKVIRPQDMPLQVANGKFDLAITGQDWVREHRYKFPSSPVVELLDLKYSRVKIVSAIYQDLPAENIAELRQLAMEKEWRLRVASEYVAIADKYARDNHLGLYRVIPTWGATEAFVPDDADLLIENTETGTTLKRHNLKIIETLFESSACLIAYQGSLNSAKAQKMNSIAAILGRAVEEN